MECVFLPKLDSLLHLVLLRNDSGFFWSEEREERFAFAKRPSLSTIKNELSFRSEARNLPRQANDCCVGSLYYKACLIVKALSIKVCGYPGLSYAIII